MNTPPYVRALSWMALAIILLSVAYVIMTLVQGRALEAQLVVALVSAGALVVGAVLSNVNGRIQQAQLAIEEDLRNKRLPIYMKVAEAFLSMVTKNPAKKRMGEKELQSFFADITPSLVLFASDEVIREWTRWRAHTYERGETQVDETPFEIVFDFEKLMYVMRKDLGYSGASLHEGEILGMFVNDIHRHIANPRLLSVAYENRLGIPYGSSTKD